MPDHTPDTSTVPIGRAVIDQAAGHASSPPVSVWVTAQSSPASQRRGRYLPESTAHPAKMLPAVAAHAITHYTRPGDLVLDPMCGIGTTLIEALHLGRPAVGVEYEPPWVQITRANL
ncbi:MAG: TRM11 family SAM-dependent methyltransferase, partial [Mycobacteriales bacterium]